MITWMQKHKKWLVITIWISTIAFVGAGFVGWGSYDYNQKGGVVAVVGDREVSVNEYQREYSELYSQYARMFGEQFNSEMAKELNLSDSAYNLVIQKNLILSYADELNLDITNSEIVTQLLDVSAFQKNGKFNKEQYLAILSQNRTNTIEYENSLKRNLLLQKIQNLFDITPMDNEVKLLNKLMFLEDNISVQIIKNDDIKVVINQSLLKKYWKPLKNNYKSANSYNLAIDRLIIVSTKHDNKSMKSHFDKFKLDYKKDDGKLKTFEEAKKEIRVSLNEKVSKKNALKKYLKLKKGKEEFDETSVFYEDKLKFPQEFMNKIKKAKNGEILKPFKHNNEFVTIKVIKSFVPKVLSFEKAIPFIKSDFIKQEKERLIKIESASILKSLKATNSINVTRGSYENILTLNKADSTEFIKKLFLSTTKEGSVSLNNLTVVYKINSSKLASYDSSKNEIVRSTLARLQNADIMNNLVKRLENTYNVQSMLDAKE